MWGARSMASSDGVLPDLGTTYSNDIAAISAQQSSISMVVFDEKTHQIIYHNDQWLENNRPYLADPSKSSYVGDDFISVYQINERAHIRHILERGLAELQKTPKARFVAFGWDANQFQTTAWRDRDFDMHFKRLDLGGAAKWIAYYGVEHFDQTAIPVFTPSSSRPAGDETPMDFSITMADKNVSMIELILLFLAYLVTFAIVWFGVKPLQASIFPGLGILSLAFIPHGVRVLGTWLYREKAILPLILAELFCAAAVTSNLQSMSDLTSHAISAMVGGGCAYAVLVLFETANIRLDFRTHSIRLWRPLVLVGLMSSVLNSIGKSLAFTNQILPEDGLKTLIGFIAGDTIGVMLCLGLLLLISRKIHLSK